MNSKKLALVQKSVLAIKDSLKKCNICPRRCGVDRTSGKTGYCRAGRYPKIYSYLSHHGEEPPISGTNGSGTIFFSHCNMKCVYCQNYRFSQVDEGNEVTIGDLSEIMIGLQNKGCHNINLVTPTHYLPQILMALEKALENGLNIPLVYNTSGYELVEIIKLLEGIVDIYLPDIRYSDDEMAKRYSDAKSYVEFNRSAVKEMRRQVPRDEIDESGIFISGMIIRLLALPNNVSGAKDSLHFIKNEIGQSSRLSIMSQYYPAFKAGKESAISAKIGSDEYKNVVDEAHILGLNKGWIQEGPDQVNPIFLGTNIEPGICNRISVKRL